MLFPSVRGLGTDFIRVQVRYIAVVLKFVHSLCSPQASHLLKCLMSAELACVEYVDDVIKELEKQIEIAQGSAKANHKVAKVRHH